MYDGGFRRLAIPPTWPCWPVSRLFAQRGLARAEVIELLRPGGGCQAPPQPTYSGGMRSIWPG